jgi:hypothetical protein
MTVGVPVEHPGASVLTAFPKSSVPEIVTFVCATMSSGYLPITVVTTPLGIVTFSPYSRRTVVPLYEYSWLPVSPAPVSVLMVDVENEVKPGIGWGNAVSHGAKFVGVKSFQQLVSTGFASIPASRW